jgi:carbonic anhydrase
LSFHFCCSFFLSCRSRGGAIQDLVRPQSEGFKDALIRDITVSVKKHAVKKIILLNHEDCGAYEGMDFKERAQELNQHTADLHAAKEIIEKEFPGVEVLLYFGYLKEGSTDEFEIKMLET